ncbi:MAG: class II aldolase/adducin family protein [Gammaproteobacteria bacterium]
MTLQSIPSAVPHPPDMTQEEWATRLNLAACYRLIAHFGMDDLVYNHISARVPGPEDHFLLNPFGLLYEEVTASNLVKVDLDGKVVSDTDDRINPAGFVIHSCIHRERHDMTCIIHTHTTAGVAVSAQRQGLLPLSQTALLYKDLIAYHEYEGLALNPDEQKRLLADLGDDKQLLILRNHGLLTCGRTIPEAFIMMFYLEQACRIQVGAQTGGEVHFPAAAVQELAHQQAMQGFGVGLGEMEFAALKRRLDKAGADYAC